MTSVGTICFAESSNVKLVELNSAGSIRFVESRGLVGNMGIRKLFGRSRQRAQPTVC
jgi:hypothetical protein